MDDWGDVAAGSESYSPPHDMPEAGASPVDDALMDWAAVAAPASPDADSAHVPSPISDEGWGAVAAPTNLPAQGCVEDMPSGSHDIEKVAFRAKARGRPNERLRALLHDLRGGPAPAAAGPAEGVASAAAHDPLGGSAEGASHRALFAQPKVAKLVSETRVSPTVNVAMQPSLNGLAPISPPGGAVVRNLRLGNADRRIIGPNENRRVG